MKVDIDLKDLTKLQTENSELKAKVQDLKKELDKHSDEVTSSTVYSLTNHLLARYLDNIFQELGFDTKSIHHHPFACNPRDLMEIARNPERLDKLLVNLVATTSKEWRSAFLEIGIVMKPDQPPSHHS